MHMVQVHAQDNKHTRLDWRDEGRLESVVTWDEVCERWKTRSTKGRGAERGGKDEE